MPRRTLEEFEGEQPTLVYIVGNMGEAEAVERLLNQEKVDYALSLEPFVTTSLLGGSYTGLFVYVPFQDYERSRQYFEAQGLMDTVDLKESQRAKSS